MITSLNHQCIGACQACVENATKVSFCPSCQKQKGKHCQDSPSWALDTEVTQQSNKRQLVSRDKVAKIASLLEVRSNLTSLKL
jgi:hypothetical protein